MKILCDENMPGSLANELRAAGLDAVDVRERNLRGANDDHVLSLALSEGRILVTMDLRRFGNLIATPPASTPGLVVVRMLSSGIRALVDRVVQFLANAREERLLGALTIVEASRTRREHSTRTWEYQETRVVPTTIKLSKGLKERIRRLIEGSEQSMHAFLLEAIEQRTSEAERRGEFVQAAVDAREEMSRTGKGFPADKVHAYARARAAGKKAPRPRARAWPK